MYLSSKSSKALLQKHFSKLAHVNKMLTRGVTQQQKLFQCNQMGLFMINKVNHNQRYLMAEQSIRFFASGDLPSHMKLEMPNLSPTMEKVSCDQFNRSGQHF